jgi:hypothetical protein
MNRANKKGSSKSMTSKPDNNEDDIVFNTVKEPVDNDDKQKIAQEDGEANITSNANYDAEIYDTSSDFKSIGVRFIY